ncbi:MULTISPECIES: endonuclease/exonuclease/phosphatase family protein [Streptomyces]|uniref:Endonuclease/exonuclease/phosphatase family protein n=1 Tax=Streptomyces flaveolus TaxID=67297 RepID=A0ABV3ADI4_9ACTN|nr:MULTISPECIES: endonuclease/exonuclease/phosphatase family protein [Streptomyces]
MRHFRPTAALLSGLLLSISLPAFASGPSTTASATAATVTAGPDADGPDLSSANRTTSAPGLPDWSRVGYRSGAPLPGNGEVTDDASCRISPEVLSSQYGVRADDGADDTTGLQKAIDDIKSQCSPSASYDQLSLITLPSGRIDLTRQVYVDASFLIVRGHGSGDGGTKLVFRPDLNTRYDTVVNGRWDQDSMKAGTGSDEGTGGWMWPGRGMFRVQTRDVADRYKDDWAAAPANRKDIFEGSVNQHWASGVKVAATAEDPGYAARRGSRTVQLVATASMSKFTPGGYVWVGAANSIKFYEQQGVTDQGVMDDLHMRQQMFKVTGVDADAKTVTLDRPLEWDLPVDSTSDGSAALGDKPYATKVTPLQIVQGVGFENFAFTQDMDGLPKLGGGTYQLTPDQAVHNYGNMAPEYAMHGIVYKWAANSWARGLKATMTGSHPIVTEDALNLQIERNSFDGAWNKGKGGNGYLRGSRVWNSLWAYNLSRNLRHFTFQWSASGNVAFRNDLDSDLNLHGGWEHNNLFEQNTVRVPYEHRSANCQTNCGGEGGEIDQGTWYPIWWAAGPKAVKWSGSSGPQNVFYNNTLIKQTSPGGPFEPYAPYGTQTGTAFQFGSKSNAPTQFEPLETDGQAIPDWTGRETLDYVGHGVVPLAVGKRPSLFLTKTGGDLDPRTGTDRAIVNWNMQGALSDGGRHNKYDDLRYMMEDAAPRGAHIVLIQEAGTPPTGSRLEFLEDHAQNVWRHPDGTYPPVREYRLLGTRSRTVGYIYWLHTNSGTTNDGRVNLAIASRTPVAPQDIHVVEPADYDPVLGQGYSRPALGISVGGVGYFTIHARADNQGQDAPELLDNIGHHMEHLGAGGDESQPWIAAGDYNRDPGDLATALPAGVYNTASTAAATHPTAGRTGTPHVLDYAVTPANNGVDVFGSSLLDDYIDSDHYPVWHYLTNLPDDSPAPSSAPPLPQNNVVVMSAHTVNVAGFASAGSNVIGDVKFDYKNPGSNLLFDLKKSSEHPGYLNLLSKDPKFYNYYLGQEGGQRDGKIVLWKSPALDQLWKPHYQGDGTWSLENYATKQYLSADLKGGALFAHDADDQAPSQRWFLQDVEDLSGRREVHLKSKDGLPWILNAWNDAINEFPVVLDEDDDAPEERFTTIPAGRTGSDECFYLANDGRYAASTNDTGVPVDGNQVTMSEFVPHADGFLWCLRPAQYGVLLANHTGPAERDEPIYLTGGALHGRVTVRNRADYAADVWDFSPVTE